MPEITRRVRIGKILTFSSDERVFSKLEKRIGMITGRRSLTKEQSDLRTFVVPSPDGYSEAGCDVSILLNLS